MASASVLLGGSVMLRGVLLASEEEAAILCYYTIAPVQWNRWQQRCVVGARLCWVSVGNDPDGMNAATVHADSCQIYLCAMVL
mmetsp:Transcript_31678/g.66617  ORF Transcript_31678/g.66617 Transcript_31678/m.66617 type:complete len:83 (+) Transcript_31678:1971-2219(+)